MDDAKFRAGFKFAGLDADGLPRVGHSMGQQAILVNKEMPANTVDHMANVDLPDGGYKPAPLTFRAPEAGVVDRVLLTTTPTDHLLIKVRRGCGRGVVLLVHGVTRPPHTLSRQVLMRHTRRPELGDKFSSRHGQKGVVGLIAAQENLPFNDQGIVPDMVREGRRCGSVPR